MQPFPPATDPPVRPARRPADKTASAETVARAVLETIPAVMQVIREAMRSQRALELTVPQFRVLAMLFHHADVSLTELAEHLGMGLPSASKLIDGLVDRSLILRTESREDRRRKEMRVTAAGRAAFGKIQDRARLALARHLADLSLQDGASIARAMGLLRRQLGPRAIAAAPKPHTRSPAASRTNGHPRSSQA